VSQAEVIAYFGPQGTFTHAAARSVFGAKAAYLECRTIADVFEALTQRRATHGVAPIENSTEGGVSATLDGLFESDVTISGELVLEISQFLVSNAGDLASIERVYSHPQALAQCKRWLAAHLPRVELVVSASTSAAAREAAVDPAGAAVASRLAAELSGLAILREGIQDRAENATRFVILSHADAPRTGTDKTSLVFSTPHERGALRRVLEVFDAEGLNLTRIESRPARGKRWEYVFFTDLEGHRLDPPVARALSKLKELCATVKVLGSYPRAG
jgi:chorismate mutase/prephenate dehydratase